MYVTHDQAEAMSLSDEIIIMHKGVIAQIGSPEDIYYKPNNEFVADFIGEVNFLNGTVSSRSGKTASVKVGSSTIETEGNENLKEGSPCKIVLRPESVSLADKGLVPCTVSLSTFMGAYQYYWAETEAGTVKITEYNPKNKKLYRVGDKAFLTFDSSNLHMLP